MSASQELGWAWEQWTNWYSHQSCHARFCLEVVWSHSGAKLCQIMGWLQWTKSYHHVFCHLGASLWPSGYESPWQTCNSLCSHKKELIKENESNLLRNPVCKGIPPNPQSRHCPEKEWSIFLGRFFSTWQTSFPQNHWKFIPQYIEFHNMESIFTGRSSPLACSKARQGNSPTRSW